MEDPRMEHNVLECILDGSMEPRDLPFPLLQKITENFSEDRKIGDGGFAIVYKGVLQNVDVAVKRIMNSRTINDTLFKREVNSLMQVNHQNIVRFLGFCSTTTTHGQLSYEGQYIYAEKRERLLCFEYMNKGNLEKYITDELRGLKWNTRYNIIKGICKGLEYLHIERHSVHMDLKPANILLDNDMVAKITDFGLSRMDDESSQAITRNRFFARGYCAPEYLLHGKISYKCDVYSLGVIIMKVVTGHRGIAHKNNVLRKWCHRWKKTGQEMPFAYLQVAKLIDIGFLCMDIDPHKRPSVSAIINELESIGQEDDMLDIEPLELYFPFVPNNQTSSSLKLTNDTNAYIAFSIETTSPLPYCIEPAAKGIVAPQSNYTVNITLQSMNNVPPDRQYTSDFVVWSTKLNESLTSENINQDMFKEQEGKVIDVVNLTVAHVSCEPHPDLPPGKGNLNSPGESNVPAKAESKYSDDEESALPAEITTSTLLSSLEMKDQANELKILEDILIDSYITPAGLSYPFFKSITRNFSKEIGCGGFGVVYLGHLRTGKVAVKKLFTSQRISEKLFLDEINCLMKTKHNNIVRFLGYCADTQGKCVPLNQRHVIAEAPHRLLCFEYVPNGNLHEYLKEKSHKDEWKIRYQMIKGICHGLNYLHEQRIIHLDLKPDNILLDACMIPKITDFGISRCFDEGISKIFTKLIYGTPGSIAPEIIDSGEITFKSDIYGLGIIIIKLLTGCNKYDFENWRTSIDVDGPQVKSCIDMAQRCVSFNQHQRPAMREIMQKLHEMDMM